MFKIQKKIMRILTFLILSNFVLSCDSSTEPVPMIPYMTLNIGDIRDFAVEPDGSRMIREITDTVSRSDGQKVYVIEITHEFSDVVYRATIYYFIKNNYLWKTKLDTTTIERMKDINPFEQEKIAMVYPEIGKNILVNEGASDSSKIFINVNRKLEKMETNIQTFDEVVEYEQFDNDLETSLKIYYVKYYGHIGSIFSQGNNTINIQLNYIKIGDKEIGDFVPLSTSKSIIYTVNEESILINNQYSKPTIGN